MKIFFKEHMYFAVMYLSSTIITISYCLLMGSIKYEEVFYLLFLNLFLLVCLYIYRYYSEKKIYEVLSDNMESLEAFTKDLGNSPLGESLNKLFQAQYSLYEKNVADYDRSHQEHLTFMNHWVHQMKTPLSVIQLYIQENEGEDMAENLKGEVEKLNKGLNMALYFARLDSFEKDFKVQRVNLYQLVIDVINEDKRLFIKNRVFPEVKVNEDTWVYTDQKWIKFVFEQIISNGVKYSKGNESKKIIIKSKVLGKLIVLDFIDEGVGIPKKDIKRVFQPFYTGENGRTFGESTGMGLYIVKKVCDSLDHKIEIESEVHKGTKIRIIFKNI